MNRHARAFVFIPLLMLLPARVQAETYVAGQLGWSFPNDVSHVEGTKHLAGFTVSDVALQNNLMYGAKLGHFFDRARWFGVETEIFNSTPHQKQQTVTITGAGISVPTPVQGTLLRVTTWAFNAVVRYPGERFQPYAGVGLGVFFAHAGDASDTTVGFNALAGARIFLTKQFAAFAEYKYQRTSGEFSASIPGIGPAGLKGDYSANSLVAGLSYHLDLFK